MRINLKNEIYLILLFCCFSGNLPAQHNKDILSLFDERFGEIDSLIFLTGKESFYSHTVHQITPVLPDSNDTKLIDQLYARRENKLISEMHGKTGVQVTGQTYYRPEREFGIDEDDPYSRYNAKLQVELGWDILQSSVYKRKDKANAVRLANEIERINEQQTTHKLLFEKNRELLQVRYDSILYGVLQHRIDNLRLLEDTYTYLLSQEKISSDELVDILNTLAEAERNQALIVKAYGKASSLSYPKCGKVTIDTSALFVYIRETNADLTKLDMRIKLLEQQQSNTNYWQNASISPFVRYSHYYRGNNKNSNNIDIGLSFKLPISLEAKRKKQALGNEINVFETRKEIQYKQIEEQICLILTEIERLNRAVGSEYRRLNDLKRYLSQRGEAYDNRIREFNRLARMKEYNLYLEALEKLYYLQYQRDFTLISLQNLIPDTSIEEFIRDTPYQLISTTL